MKILIFIVLASLIALTCGVFVPPRPGHKKLHLLGEKECTYGPSYWCQNLTNAADCHATKHCIQTVWIHKQYPEDRNSICDTCKEMVKEARDQLESNETQELIKEVFEGSCALLRLKPIVEECDKIADDYIPDLIDTLASEMDPATVCAVAGLCNNPRIHQLLAEAGEQISQKPSEVAVRNRCDDCNTVLDIVVKKFKSSSRDDVLESMLEVCGEFGSFSDSCSNIVITYFSDIYSFLQENLNARDVCLLSGECSTNFHKHDVEITPMSKIGYVPVADDKDDLPCELCEQLVNHLREVLVANTTEAEFKQVLEGICKQTKSFKDECLNIVDEYYEVIYNSLIDKLNATATCELINICPRNAKGRPLISPLLSVDTAEDAIKLSQQPEHVYIPKDDIVIKVMQNKPENPILSAEDMQLPIDLLVPPHQQMYNQEVCVFCEYFLHCIQNEITDPTNQDEIRKTIDKACSKLPKSVNETCVEFVNTYEPALVAILAQEIDPSQICPMIHACPKENVKDVEIFINTRSSGSCQVCLYAVTELEGIIKDDKSRENIKKALAKVCSHLPGNLKPECSDFINTYTDELVDMFVAEFTPEEVCVYLKMCTNNTPVPRDEYIVPDYYIGDTETNAIHDNTVNGRPVEDLGSEQCILCEFIMEAVEKKLKDKNTDDEIKNIVHDICNVLPGTVKAECNKFVDQYADAIIILLQEAADPKEICTYMGLCKKAQYHLEFVREEVSKCGVCRSAADIISTILRNPKVDQNMNHIFEKTCRGVPSDMKKTCMAMFFKNEKLGYTLVKILNTMNDSATSYKKPIECLICKLVVNAIKLVIGNQHVTIDVIKHILENVCQDIPFWLRNSCTDFVQKYVDSIAQLIMTLVDANLICSKLGVCEMKHIETDLTEIVKENDVFVTNGRDICTPCKILSSVIKSILQTPDISKMIGDGIRSICNKLRDPLKNICHNEYNLHWQDFMNMVNKFNAEQFCRTARMCSTWEELPIIEDIGRDICTPCKILSSVIKSMLQSPDISKMIGNGIRSICNKLPDPLKNICHNEYNQHWQDFMNMLNKFNAEQFCRTARMCSAWEKIPIIEDIGRDICTPCKILSSVIKSILQSPDISKMIGNEIRSICNKLPDPLKNICHNEYNLHWQDFMNMLNKFNAEQFCRTARMCSTWEEIPIIEDIGRDTCTPCKLLSNVVISILKNPNVANTVKDAINKICGLLPDPLKNICHSELNTHWRDFENFLRKFNAEQFCRNIKLCSVKQFEIMDVSEKDNGQKCINMGNKINTIMENALGIFSNILKYFCNDLDPKYMDFCLEIKQYEQELENLVKKVDAQRFCKTIHVSPQSDEVSVIIVSALKG